MLRSSGGVLSFSLLCSLLAFQPLLSSPVSRPPLPRFLVGPGPASSFYPGSWLFPSARPSWVSGGGQSGYPGLQESAGLAKIGLPSRTLSPSHPLVFFSHLLLSWSPRPCHDHLNLAVCYSKDSPRSIPNQLVVVVRGLYKGLRPMPPAPFGAKRFWRPCEC